ncbi:ESCRT-0 subunit protein hse1 [Clydaea vesicula]|uniref:Class E vacuolar protein-sorting machinery protein HSE1 n=1 Tax=Clydaea vesicula TaxID=447962 RepID=A0AAD5TZN7_9FUNG|nr:ESCRT-0 subunit protein hse1 [Clydaea vesicula]
MDPETLVNSCTNENNTSENWPVIIQICEMADKNDASARQFIQAIIKRLQNKNINVVLFSLTLSNSLVQNCSSVVRKEICSRPFLDPLVKILNLPKTHFLIKERILDFIQSWNELLKHDHNFSYMSDVYNQLKNQNFSFPSNDKPKDYTPPNPDKHKEDEEMELAIALSLSAISDKENVSKQTTVREKPKPELPATPPHLFSVRALYDFPGLDEGELQLRKGDICKVFDNFSFKDWYKGSLNGRIGIFPSNYVEKIVDGENVSVNNVSAIGSNNQLEYQVLNKASKVDHFLTLLNSVDPSRSISENNELQDVYQDVLSLRPNVIKLLEKFKFEKENLNAANERFLRSIQTYHKLMDAGIRNRQQQNRPPLQQHNFPTPFQQSQPDSYQTMYQAGYFPQPVRDQQQQLNLSAPPPHHQHPSPPPHQQSQPYYGNPPTPYQH